MFSSSGERWLYSNLGPGTLIAFLKGHNYQIVREILISPKIGQKWTFFHWYKLLKTLNYLNSYERKRTFVRIRPKIVRKNSNSYYLNTVHNRLLAKNIELSNLNRCPSFKRYPEFLEKIFPQTQVRAQTVQQTVVPKQQGKKKRI